MINIKNLLTIHSTKEIINIFSHTFLGIYFFNITQGSFSIVALYYLIYYISHILWRYIISKVINSNNILKIYRFSIITNLCISLILLIFRENIVTYIYAFALIYALSQCLYWTTYEILISNIRDKSLYKKFFMYDSVLCNTSNIIFPILFGGIIKSYNYIYIFTILLFISIISLVLSFRFKYIDVKMSKFSYPLFIKNIKDKSLFNKITFQYFADGMTNGGVAQLLVTILIYNKLSDELIIGGLASFSAVICIVIALVSQYKLNDKNYKKIVLFITCSTLIITIPVGYIYSIILIIVYKILLDISDTLTNIEGNKLTFEALDKVCSKKHTTAYLWHQEAILNIGRGAALIIIIFILCITNDINSLSFLLIIFSAFLVIRTIIISSIQIRLKEIETAKNI